MYRVFAFGVLKDSPYGELEIIGDCAVRARIPSEMVQSYLDDDVLANMGLVQIDDDWYTLDQFEAVELNAIMHELDRHPINLVAVVQSLN